MSKNYGKTLRACYLGFITQAICANFIPLLFLKFHNDYSIPLGKIALISTTFFFTQLIVDFLCTYLADRIGYRICIVTSEVCAALGLIGLAFLPDLFADPFVGILIAVVIYAIGSGLIEVLISPIVEACPTERKEAAMTLLHSFYCWGQAIVITVSTAFFVVFGVSAWRYMSFAWAVLPLVNIVMFSLVPINTLGGENKPAPIRDILRNPTFWILAVMMTAAGASEIAMCQWASAFTESGLGVTKTVGDIAGPCAFALLAGSARLIYAKFSTKINLVNFMGLSCALCTLSYLLSALSPNPVLALFGCALCGFSSGVLWPGIFSIAPRLCPSSGVAVFALLALAGDLGCAIGPATIGFVSDIFGGDLHIGMLAAAVFPFIGFLALITLKAKEKKVI
ncbi:MAG: MFS transporter [Clostridia bacterium]|nr:MFS transporter [Clostridia bacterium]